MRILRYDWVGAAGGLWLLLVATLIAAWERHGSIGAAALGAVQASEPLLWLIDTTPLVLGAIGFAVDRQRRLVVEHQERIVRLEHQRRASLERTAAELSRTALNLLDGVSTLGSASARMTTSVRETIETMTSLSHGATAIALAAETVAGRALDAASRPMPTVEDLAAALRSAAGGAKEIARTAQEQMDGIERILASMNEIHFATEESAESTGEIAIEAQALSDYERELRVECGGAPLNPRGGDALQTPAPTGGPTPGPRRRASARAPGRRSAPAAGA